jgi:D-alanyl-D-alanine carboxypeptidase
MNDREHESVDVPVTGGEETERVPIFSQLSILAVVLFLLVGSAVLPRLFTAVTPAATPVAFAPIDTIRAPSPPNEDVFANVSLTGQAAFVWDVANQRALYQQAADEQLPLASITKLMTALLANELLTSTTTVTISRAALNQDGASGLLAEEQFTLLNISDLMLLTSSNDGAYAVAETLGQAFDQGAPAEAFVALMNIRADELGLTQTQFRNPTGLDISSTEAGAYGSARDVAFLMEHILTTHPAIIEATADPAHTVISRNGITHTARNTNQSVRDIPGIIGSKTGFTELAGGNLVIAWDAAVNRPMIAVVLGSTWSERFRDIDTLVNYTQRALE